MSLLTYKNSDLSVIGSIGFGATSEVYRVCDKFENEFAYKKFHSHLFRKNESRDLLNIEIETLLKLNHPNVVKLFGPVSSNNEIGILLEFVDGVDFREWISLSKLKVWEPCAWILVQVLRGLGAAHELNFLHRDLKFENVLINKHGVAKLSDFGLAKHLGFSTITNSGQLVGSLPSMSPESINGHSLNFASDIYSFGVMAYEAFSGVQPFSGVTPQEIIKKILEGKPRDLSFYRPDLPEELLEVIRQCLNRDPKLRPQNVWQIEALFMNRLSELATIPLIKTMCCIPIDSKNIATFLQIKHSRLLDIINSETSNRGVSPVKAYHELQRVFPDDQSLLKLNSLIKNKKETMPWLHFFNEFQTSINFNLIEKRSLKKVVVSIFLLFILLASFVLRSKITSVTPMSYKTAELEFASGTINLPFYLNLPLLFVNFFSKEMKSDQSHVLREENIENENSSKKTRENSRRVSMKLSPKSEGTLKFEGADGLEVEIDDQPIHFQDTSIGLKVPVGIHKLKLIRQGYLPIESKIEIKKGKETLINVN